MSEAWTWTTDSGEVMTAQPGDWKVRDAAGVRSVAAGVFERSYQSVGPGRYRRTGVFRARRAIQDEVVETLEGQAVVHPGDWVVEGAGGEQWPVPAEHFARSYEEIGEVD